VIWRSGNDQIKKYLFAARETAAENPKHLAIVRAA